MFQHHAYIRVYDPNLCDRNICLCDPNLYDRIILYDPNLYDRTVLYYTILIYMIVI